MLLIGPRVSTVTNRFENVSTVARRERYESALESYKLALGVTNPHKSDELAVESPSEQGFFFKLSVPHRGQFYYPIG